MLREMEEMWMSEMDLMTEWNVEGVEKMGSLTAAAVATPLTKNNAALLLEPTEFAFEKWSDEKLALNIEDVSTCFDDLVKGLEPDVTEILPASPVWEAPDMEQEKSTTEEEQEQPVEHTETEEAWIEDLEKDVSNVNDLCEMFDVLVENENQLMDQATKETEEEDDDDCEEEDEDMSSSEDEGEASAKEPVFVPAAPSWIPCAPLDPRSCIRTPVFNNLDPRIPQISVPRIDLGFSKPDTTKRIHPSLCMVSPKPKVPKSLPAKQHVHDPLTCWICKSKSSPERKRALHRYQEKKSRRIWTRGPRYKGRSVVASVRVRNGGRFIQGAQWI